MNFAFKSLTSLALALPLCFWSSLSLADEIYPGQSESCWSESLSGNGICDSDTDLFGNPAPYTRVCIEWESFGVVVGTSCCATADLPFLGCTTSCLAIERPLLTAPVPTETLPGGDAVLKLDQSLEGALERPFRVVRAKMPVRFEDQVLSGDNQSQLDGKTLHYLFVLDDGTGVSALYALASRDALIHAVNELDRSSHPTVEKRRLFEDQGGVSLFADEKWQHASYFLEAGSGVDFRAGWWTGKISSLRGVGSPTWVTLYAGEGYSGSSLTFSTAWDRPSLEAFDWNDRTRSAYVWPQNDKDAALNGHIVSAE